jgi:hypothetical protein
MNSDMAGKITSDVKTAEEVRAAVAKELNATSKGMPLHNVVLKACRPGQEWNNKNELMDKR